MLRVGVTGGIGSGKSTVSRRLTELGAVVVDADAVARQVVEPGQPALEAIRAHFGDDIIREDGTLDRAALAAIVFPDPEQLRALEAITGPAINARVAALRRAGDPGAVSVFDMPLLVERGLWPHEHLTVVVETDVKTRVARLVQQRGLDEADARARIAAQATDDQRRAAADVVLDNSGSPAELAAAVDRLWQSRIDPFNDNLVHAERARRPSRGAVVEARDDWAAEGQRVVAKLAAALASAPGHVEVEHIGSTSVSGLLAKDVIDVQVGVGSLAHRDSDTEGVTESDSDTARGGVFERLMGSAGYLRKPGLHHDTPHPGTDDPAGWSKNFYGGCDPGRIVHVHVREIGSPGWRFALLFRDWLRARPDERDSYAAEKRRLLAIHDDTSTYTEAKEPWFAAAHTRANAWAARVNWTPR